MAISPDFSAAQRALLAHETALAVTGNNIANVNTPGYSRQLVDLAADTSTPTGSGTLVSAGVHEDEHGALTVSAAGNGLVRVNGADVLHAVGTRAVSGGLDGARIHEVGEVHGLLQALTALGNSEHAGRRLFGGLALDAPPPFADPDTPGYTAATAYTGSTAEFEVKVGNGTTDRVRLSTQGDQVFGTALQALESLETALATNGDASTTLASLEQGRAARRRARQRRRPAGAARRPHDQPGRSVAPRRRDARQGAGRRPGGRDHAADAGADRTPGDARRGRAPRADQPGEPVEHLKFDSSSADTSNRDRESPLTCWS